MYFYLPLFSFYYLIDHCQVFVRSSFHVLLCNNYCFSLTPCNVPSIRCFLLVFQFDVFDIRLLLCNKSHWNHGYTCLVANLVHRCPCKNFELRHPYVVKACIYIHTHIYMYIYVVQQDNFSSISEHRIKYITERTFDRIKCKKIINKKT